MIASFRGGQSLSIFLEFTALTLPNVILNVIPVAVLIATLYGLNRMSSDSELIVARASGIGPWRLARAIFAFGAFTAFMVSLLAHFIVPNARTELAQRSQELAADVTTQFLTEGEFLHPGQGITVYVRAISERGELLGLFLEDSRSARVHTSYTAERAVLLEANGAPRLIMFNGMAQSLMLDTDNLTIVTFDDFSYDLGALSTRSDRKRNYRELTTFELLVANEQTPLVEKISGSLGQMKQELHERFSRALFAGLIPFMCLGFMLVGSYSRLGLWRQILAAVFAAITVQMLMNVISNEVIKTPTAWLLMYIPPAILLILGSCTLGLITYTRKSAP